MNTFTQKLGPLPVWVWGSVAGLAVLAYVYFGPKGAAGNTAPATTTLATTTDTGYKADGSNTGSTYTTPVATPIENNQSWLTSAVNMVTGSGVSPLDAQTALQGYLQGDELTASQSDIVNKALALKGVAPEGTSKPTFTAVTPTNWADGTIYKSFYRRKSDLAIIGITATGQEHHITWAEWLAMGNPDNRVIGGFTGI